MIYHKSMEKIMYGFLKSDVTKQHLIKKFKWNDFYELFGDIFDDINIVLMFYDMVNFYYREYEVCVTYTPYFIINSEQQYKNIYYDDIKEGSIFIAKVKNGFFNYFKKGRLGFLPYVLNLEIINNAKCTVNDICISEYNNFLLCYTDLIFRDILNSVLMKMTCYEIEQVMCENHKYVLSKGKHY